MSLIKDIKEYSVVRLKDGREATIMHRFHAEDEAYCAVVDVDGADEMIEVLPEEVECITWVPPENKN